MDYQKWSNTSFANVLEYNMLAAEMTEDLAVQLAQHGDHIHRSVPKNYRFEVIVTSNDESNFVSISTNDMRTDEAWLNNVRVVALEADYSPKPGMEQICSWKDVGAVVAKQLA